MISFRAKILEAMMNTKIAAGMVKSYPEKFTKKIINNLNVDCHVKSHHAAFKT